MTQGLRTNCQRMGVSVLAVVLLVTLDACTSSSSSTIAAPSVVPAGPAVVAEVARASKATAGILAATTGIRSPDVADHQPAFVIDGKPGVLFIGGEFCPYCAAERWALIMALARFGTFAGLKETTSSPWDVDPSTATFSFRGSSYKSAYITFDPKEYESNDTTGPATRRVLEPLTSQEQVLWTRYSELFGLPGTEIPFVDIGNTLIVDHPSYNPAILAGLDQQQIAAMLADPDNPVTQAIGGTADYLTAGVCSVTNQEPTSVCGQTGVVAAGRAIGLGQAPPS